MKVMIGGLYHESNTFNPFPTDENHFVFVEGIQVLERVCSTKVFNNANVEIIPSIYATALSSGIVTEKAYRFFADKIISTLEDSPDINGIWLHLHGAMTVENIGSAELQLLKEIREVVGFQIPISLTLDIHGNIPPELMRYANIIRAYRTVPHTDQSETEKITAQLLVNAMKSKDNVVPSYVQIPLIISGEQALGNRQPLKSIFEKLYDIEEIEGIATASYFIGFAWADVPHSAGCVIVVPENASYAEAAEEQANLLAEYIYEERESFQFDAIALDPEEAIDRAIIHDSSPVFISDSGDNTTGGAVGTYTELLRSILNKNNYNNKKICIAAIFDENSYNKLAQYEVGETVSINVGLNHNEHSKPVEITGTIKTRGNLLGYLGGTDDYVGKTCTISIGDIDVVIANKGHSFITINHFNKAGLNIDDYDIVVVKQGYLFPELSKISKLDILALTPGATYQLLNELKFEHINRPVFPLDK